MSKTFNSELRELINRYSIDNECDTPDIFLVDYISRCLTNWHLTTKNRDEWFGFNSDNSNRIATAPERQR